MLAIAAVAVDRNSETKVEPYVGVLMNAGVIMDGDPSFKYNFLHALGPYDAACWSPQSVESQAPFRGRQVRLHVGDPLAPLILRGARAVRVPYRSLTSMWPGIVVVR